MGIRFVKERKSGEPIVDADGNIIVENSHFVKDGDVLKLAGQGVRKGSPFSLERFVGNKDAQETHKRLMEATGGKMVVVENPNAKKSTGESSFSQTLSRVLGKK